MLVARDVRNRIGRTGKVRLVMKEDPRRLTKEERLCLTRMRAMLAEPGKIEALRALLWAEFAAWQASQDAAAWAPLREAPAQSTPRKPHR
jgi:hypothetical protein